MPRAIVALVGFLGMVLGTLTTQTAEAGISIGHLDAASEAFGLSGDGGSYIVDARADLFVFGHSLFSTPTITPGFLAGVDAFYLGLLFDSLSGAEKDALFDFVNSGHFLFIQQDFGGGTFWHAPANEVLDLFGAHAAETITFSTHLVGGAHPIATTPNPLVGETFGSAANSFFDVFVDYDLIATDSITGAPTLIHKDPAGTFGHVVSSTDIDMWSSAGGYGAGTNNQKMWENIWHFGETHHTLDGEGNGNGQAVIPEPSTLLLFGLGGLGTGFARRLRRKFLSPSLS